LDPVITVRVRSIIVGSVVDFIVSSHTDEFPVTTVDLSESARSNWRISILSVSVNRSIGLVDHPDFSRLTSSDLGPHSFDIEALESIPTMSGGVVIGNISSSEDSIVSTKDEDVSATASNLSSCVLAFASSAEVILSEGPSFTDLIVINDSSSIIDLVVSANSPDMSVSTDSNIKEVRFFDFSPVGSSSSRGRDSVSVVDLVLVIDTPNVSISSDVNVDHSSDTVGLFDFSPAILSSLSDWTKSFEPNIVTVVDTPEDWSVTNRDIHKLTSDLVPGITLFHWVSSDIVSAHDLMVGSNTAHLTVSNIQMDEVGFHSRPGVTLVVPSVDSTSVDGVVGVIETPNLTILTNGDILEKETARVNGCGARASWGHSVLRVTSFN
jgi:hypothetical protein